jgi:hypothetical protein
LRTEIAHQRALTAQKRPPALAKIHAIPAETPFEALLKDPVEAACVSAVKVLEAKLK